MQQNALSASDFSAFFSAIWGFDPFPWQKRLLHHLATGQRGIWPEVLDMPTGSGKTATLDIAVFHLASEVVRKSDRRAPVRIAFVVDRRLIVDDAFERANVLARALRNALKQPEAASPIVLKVARALTELSGTESAPLIVRRLRGGAPREDDWARTPVQPTILCSTVDQVGSRLLFRGYGISDSMKPIHAGLLGSDCLILLDEAHLSNPFRETLQALKSLRAPDAAQFQVALLTATPGADVQRQFELKDDDYSHPVLSNRIKASKPAHLIEFAGKQGVDTESQRADQVSEAARGAIETLRKDGIIQPAIGVVLNRVARARAVFERLRATFNDADVILLIGPARAVERARLADNLAPIRTGRIDDRRRIERPLIVVATQTIEAGVDIDFDGLVTEAAALDALRQRFGRLNRAGRKIMPIAIVLAHREDISSKADDPVYGDRIKTTWDALERVGKETGGVVDFGIDALNSRVSKTEAATLASPVKTAPVLLPAYADLWSQTWPAPNADPDIALFLHGRDTSPPSVQIVWRADIEVTDLRTTNRERLIELFELMPPRAAEAIEAPLWAVRAWLRADANSADFADAVERIEERPDGPDLRRPVFCWAGKDSGRTGIVSARELRNGDMIVVPAGYGSCDQWGWNPESERAVVDVADQALWPYRARRFAVRVTPALIAQELMDRGEGDFPPAENIVDELINTLDDHAEDRPERLLDAIMDIVLPNALKARLSALRDDRRGRLAAVFAYGLNGQERPRGVVFIAPAGLQHRQIEEDLAEAATPATEDDEVGSRSPSPETLIDHCENVRKWAQRFASVACLAPQVAFDVGLAAFLHDCGKADPRYQSYFAGGDPYGPDPKQVLAKSGQKFLPRDAWAHAGLPDKWRHEALSVRVAVLHPEFARANDPELVLWLIGSHHGRGRPLFPHADGRDAEVRPNLLSSFGIAADLDPGAGPQSLCFDFGGSSWQRIFIDLKQRYGVWGLARLETFVRLADHRASESGVPPEAINYSNETPASAGGPPKNTTQERRTNGPTRTRYKVENSLRLEGLDSNNLLAILALLGLMRTLQAARPTWRPRVAWDLEHPPIRPILYLGEPQSPEAVCVAACEGATTLAGNYDFPESPLDGASSQRDLNYSDAAARKLLQWVVAGGDRERANLWAALLSDAAAKNGKVEATPLCLLFGQGHQHFLDRLAAVPRIDAPPPRGKGKKAVALGAAETLHEALFQPWTRQDPTPAFRWDPAEDVRYALRADDPSGQKSTTQHGANRLAALALPVFTAAPSQRGQRVRLQVLGGAFARNEFAFFWPIWSDPADLAGIRALVGHPDLARDPAALGHLGVAGVRMTRRIGVGKFMNFTWAESVTANR